MTDFAQKVIETVERPQFKGDMLLAYIWNSAAAVLGRTDIPSHATGTRIDDLRRDVEAVLSREAYQHDGDLQALRYATA